MKHIVTVTTSNPAHEHISLRRRQSTTNYMVEARDEQEAVLRASAHFRRLGHYIHETKIFKKKDEQLNEFTGAARLATAALRSPAIQGVLQSGKTSLGKLFKDEVKNAGIGYGTSAIANAILPSTHDKETSLGSVVSGRIGGGAISSLARKLATKVPQKMSTNIADLLKPLGSAVGQTAGKIVISPTTRPDLKPSPLPQPKPAPVPAPQPGPAPVLPQPKPAPSQQPVPVPQPQPKPAPVPSQQPVPVPKQSPPVTQPPPIASPKSDPRSDPRQLPATSGKGGGKPPVGKPPVGKPPVGKPRPRPSPFVFPRLRLGDRPDQDIGTLGQYRGMFPLYQFADFNSLRESQVKPMNAIGRVMTKRKEKNKEDAEAEKNKINMEPTLKSGKN